MNRFIKAISKILIIAFLFTSIFMQNGNTYAAKQGKPGVVKDKVQILVKYKNDSKGEAVKTKLKDKLKLSKLELKKKHGRIKTELLEINAEDNAENIIKELKKDSNVEYAQLNLKLTVMTQPQDERYGEQWGLNNIGQTIQFVQGTSGFDIDVEKAWEITMGSPAVLVAVLDTGIDITHNDLKSSIFQNANEIPDNGIDDDGNGYVDDINGWDFANDDGTVFDSASSDTHGTHVAGIISASADSKGVIGVAPKTKILPLKFIENGGGYTSDAIDAIEYAKQMGVKIVNCSFGGTVDNPALKDAMESSGMLFVCSAGNNSNNLLASPMYPAAFNIPNKLSVAALNSNGSLADFSNYGANVDIAAPGMSILSTIPDGMYNYMSGTSMASGFVSGAAALVSSQTPDMTGAQLAARIKNSVKKLDSLDGKVVSTGFVNTAKALNNTTESIEETAPEVPKTEKEASKDSMVVTLAATISLVLQEQIHFGEEGVSVSTGNFSKSCTDMSISAPGFNINISRTYNSKETRPSSTMGRGWTFGFEGSIKQDTSNSSLWTATLPSGAAQNFVRSGNTYTANDSHSKLVKNADGSYILTTKDQYTYGFNSSGWLIWMKDRNGNAVNIQVDGNGKVKKITDCVGREFSVLYNNHGLITSVSNPLGWSVKYDYDANKRLQSVTDPDGNIIATYEYDSYNCLSKVKDFYGTVTDEIIYLNENGLCKVLSHKDVYGNIDTYSYDTTNRITTIIDSNGREIKKWYDTALYIVKSQDTEYSAGTCPNLRQTMVEYYTDSSGFNKFGEEKSITDRNGNKTEYTRDANGNITKILNPDGSFREYTYDEKNNLTMEKDETGRCTYYIYDANKTNLIKIIQPLNVSDAYTDENDQSKYAITGYRYYSDVEAAELGYKAKGLLKSETDPEGNTTTYEYDTYGNRTMVTNPTGNTNTYGYNIIGWLTYSISPRGYRTDFYYDNNGRLEKTLQSGGETTRIVYNPMGWKIQEISPNQYDPEKDNLSAYTYNDNTVGQRYEYYSSGKLHTETDAENNVTTYEYDIYGNLTSKTTPEGTVYLYYYDVMNRIKREAFKNDSDKLTTAITLKDYDYGILADGRTTITEKKYINDTEAAVTVYKYDYNGKLIEQLNPDNTKKRMRYYANGTLASTTDANGSSTYIRYDGLNNTSETWSPIEPGKYSYTSTTYYKNGKKKSENASKDKVELYSVPVEDRLITKSYEYYDDGNLKAATDSTSGKITYSYDSDGNMSEINVYTSNTSTNTTEYEYNYMGKPVIQRIHVKSGALYPNDVNSTADTCFISKYNYDKNGNLKSITEPDGNTTTYTYDNLNRMIGEQKPGIDENGYPVSVKTLTSYNWEGKVISSTDANGNITSYEYDKRGFLEKAINAENGVTLYGYDIAGRKILEVSPKNYDSTNTIEQMDRTVYAYDNMDRVLTQTEVFQERKVDPTTYMWLPETLTATVVKAYKYDANGNVIKELDGEGYKFGVGTDTYKKINSGYGTTYTYTLSNQPATILDTVSKERNLTYTKKFVYDGAGRKISETNAQGHVTCYSYDDAGRVLSVSVKKSEVSPEQMISSTTYDMAGNPIETMDGRGNITRFEYNSLGKLSKTICPGDVTIPEYTVTCQYDVSGNLAKQQDSIGRVQLFTYDNENRVLSTTETDNTGKQAITTYSRYDKVGNKRFEVDGNGTEEENTYDKLNRLKRTKVAVTLLDCSKIEHITQYGYDMNGNQTTVTDWLDNVATNVYDPINRLIERIDSAQKSIQKLEYNSSNLQIRSYGAFDDSTITCTQFKYDRNNRLLITADPEGNVTSQSYDNSGNVASEIDGRGNITKYTYDQFQRLIKVTNALGEATCYTYDLCGNMLTQTDGKGNTIMFEYNARNMQVKRIDANGRTGSADKYMYIDGRYEEYTYNADGSIAGKLDRNGKTTVYSYDIHKRLLSQAIDDQVISYTYDNNGNQLTITDGTGKTTRTYDELGRVITKYVPGIGSNTYRYDVTSNIPEGCSFGEISKDVKGNSTTKYYDSVGRLKQVKDADITSAVYEYYDNGASKSVTYPSGAKEEYTYYKNNVVKTLTNNDATGNVLESYMYWYDAANNQIKKSDSKGDTIFGYDKLNRLSKTVEPNNGRITAYEFDAAGNREIETIKEGTKFTTTTYTYNEQNRLTKTFKTDSEGIKDTTLYSYDNNGNMLGKSIESSRAIDPANPPQPRFWMYFDGEGSSNPNVPQNILNGTASYEYDVWNQMIKASTGDGTTESRYNGDGLRVEKTVNGQTTRYLYEYDKVVLEVDDKGRQTARNLYGKNLISRKVDTETLYYMYNGHADVTTLIDNSGTIQASYYYDAFGTPIDEYTNENGKSNPIRYAGYQYDGETDLYYLNARYYDSKIARFLSEDTFSGYAADPLSLNLYTYCHNNPIKYFDPTGHTPQNSIVDYLNSKNQNSSYSARKGIAKELGIQNYSGTAAQNTQMLKTLQEKDKRSLKPTTSSGNKGSTPSGSTPNTTSKGI